MTRLEINFAVMRKVPYIFFVLALVMPLLTEAQCSMCKAVAESDLKGGGTAAAGLNSGILYLMMFPYLLIGIVAFSYYYYRKKLTGQEDPLS